MSQRSTLIYDGACNICQEWVNNWQKLTGDKVIYRPYQEAAPDFSDISLDEFKRSIYLIEADSGKVSSGAEAAFRLNSNSFPYSLLLFLYKTLPGFAFLSELAYQFFSKHRAILTVVTHVFWGRNFQPSEYYLLTRFFLIFLGCIYFGAFASFAVQAQGLIGSDGILPLSPYLDRLNEHFGNDAILKAPMIFWINASNPMIQFTCIAGCLFSLLVIFNRFTWPSLLLLYVLYLSLYYAGQIFMSYQWDILLLEVGFLAIFIGQGSRIVVWLYRWLMFRFMLLGGLVKLLSHDPTWDNLTALTYHFETQPLPSPLAWYAHQLPEIILMVAVAITLIVEIVLPFLIFAPRRIRFIAAGCFILLQIAIILTGNYNFFNLLPLALCLLLFDDAALKTLMPGRVAAYFSNNNVIKESRVKFMALILLAVVLVYSSVDNLNYYLSGDRNKKLSLLSQSLTPLIIVNNYGPFAVMTTTRNEIIVEGSADGINWREYKFNHKPDDLDKLLIWIIPHQPRLDWQMWFAALSSVESQIWFRRFLYLLLYNEPRVTDLLKENPFEQSAPKYVRASFFKYNFTNQAQRTNTGNIWVREYLRPYHPPFRLKSDL